MKYTKSKTMTARISLVAFLAGGGAFAHVSVASGPATANESREIAFGVGHGCSGADTSSITVEIPAGLTSVRPVPSSEFSQLDVQMDDTGAVVAVTWTKLESTVLESDLAYYKLVLRAKVPDAPFTTLTFPVYQTCLTADGEELTSDWVGDDAAVLHVLPPKYPGWNKMTLGEDIDDLSTYFSDAQILWRGDAAYSTNPTTVELIGETDGVTLLESLRAGDEIWVRY